MIEKTEFGIRARIGNDTVHVFGDTIIVTIDGEEHRESGLRHGSMTTNESELAAALSFLSAAGESVNYQERKGQNPFELDEDGDRINDGNQWLFQETISRWASKHSDELSIHQIELEEEEA